VAIRIWFDFQWKNEIAAKPLNDRARRRSEFGLISRRQRDFTIELFGLSIPVISAPEFLQVA
jgi:hypothetical protein